MKFKAIIFSILMIFAVMFCGCPEQITSKNAAEYLPKGAEVIKDYGNGWVHFKLGIREFLFYREYGGNHGYAAVTVIP